MEATGSRNQNVGSGQTQQHPVNGDGGDVKARKVFASNFSSFYSPYSFMAGGPKKLKQT